MINGNAHDFINGLHYGDERFFIYDHKKYFIQGIFDSNQDINPSLELYIIDPPNNTFEWHATSKDDTYPVSSFESAKIFNNKSFWDIEKEIQWVDC